MTAGDLIRQMGSINGRAILLMDSISYIDDSAIGQIVISGSHGGAAAGRYALAKPPFLVVFNDAGVGKEGAGIVALTQLAAAGVAAVAVSHQTARIGEAEDTWLAGVIAHVNEPAAVLGLAVGVAVQTAVCNLIGDS